MLKVCSKCGRVHDTNYKCKSKALPLTNEQALRSTYKWARKSEDIRERSFHLCEVCKYLGKARAEAVEVHHIVKIKHDPTLLLEDGNLITLCVEHHKEADSGKLDPDFLRYLVSKRDKAEP